MIEPFASAVAVTTGLVLAGVGVIGATKRVRMAQRAHAKTAALCGTLPEGWDAWFVSGFSDVTMGTRWLFAVAVGCAWVVVGVCFIGLGLHLLLRI